MIEFLKESNEPKIKNLFAAFDDAEDITIRMHYNYDNTRLLAIAAPQVDLNEITKPIKTLDELKFDHYSLELRSGDEVNEYDWINPIDYCSDSFKKQFIDTFNKYDGEDSIEIKGSLKHLKESFNKNESIHKNTNSILNESKLVRK